MNRIAHYLSFVILSCARSSYQPLPLFVQAHVVAPEKKKRKRGDTETAVSEVELPGEPDEAADAGSSEALERKKIKAKKKKKKKRDTKSDEAVEAKATENASQSETESLGSGEWKQLLNILATIWLNISVQRCMGGGGTFPPYIFQILLCIMKLLCPSSFLKYPEFVPPSLNYGVLSSIAGSTRGRRYTVSIALPGSIVNNAQTLELKTYLAGQVTTYYIIHWWATIGSIGYSILHNSLVGNYW